MIAKVSASEHLAGALGYNFKKVASSEAAVLLTSGLYQEPDGGYTLSSVLSDMQACLPSQHRTKKVVFHCSLNPHPDEQLSDEMLCHISKEYMTALGYGDQPYIVFKHSDIAREHIHIVSLRVDYGGKKINDKFEGRRSKAITDAMEQRYGLIPSSTASIRNLGPIAGIDITQGQIKEQISRTLRSALLHYHVCSLGELNAVLSHYNIAAEEVKTEFRGKKYNGLVYAPTDELGRKIGTPINATEIGRGVGHSAVTGLMRRSKQAIKPLIPAMRMQVRQAMQTSPQNVEELQERLGIHGLRAYVRTTAEGRIYGITFIDDEQGIALNGSRLGKGYTARVFHNYFTHPESYNPFLDETLYGESERCSPGSEDEGTSARPEKKNAIEEVLDELPMPPLFSTSNEDWKEVAWQRKLRHQALAKRRRR